MESTCNFKGKKILILGGSEFQIPLLKKAKMYGLIIGLIDINENNSCRNYSDFYYKCSIKDKQEVLKIAKQFNPDGITVGITDSAVQTCSFICSEMGLPGLNINASINATNKYEMIKRFKEFDVPSPDYTLVDIKTTQSPLGYPAIIKPINMAGSKGIFKVNNDEELKIAIKKGIDICGNQSLLMEEYMEGPEVSVELVVIDNKINVIQITDKTTTGPPHFIEIGHFQPSQLPESIKTEIEKVAKSAVKALGMDNCLGHAELKITKEGPKMVEIGARAGGDGIGEQLIQLSTGVDFQEISIKLAFGMHNFNILKQSGCCAYITFFPSQPGIIDSIDGIDDVANIENIYQLRFNETIGNNTVHQSATDNAARFGYIICTGRNYDETKECMEKARSSLKINMRKSANTYYN